MNTDWQKALSKMTYGIYALTSFNGTEINGMIASWVSQISHEPPLLMVAVHPNRYSHEMIQKSGCFALNILRQDQKDYLSRFKGPDPGTKFSSIPWTKGKTGCPICSDCIAYLECNVASTLKPGNHTLYIGKVIDAGIFTDWNPMSTLDYKGTYIGNI
jgi:flavin reductase (DIM6/NTAB) family NADH-FMN oxidoreductase RutF